MTKIRNSKQDPETAKCLRKLTKELEKRGLILGSKEKGFTFDLTLKGVTDTYAVVTILRRSSAAGYLFRRPRFIFWLPFTKRFTFLGGTKTYTFSEMVARFSRGA